MVIKVQVLEWLVTLVGKSIVGMNPFFKTVFKYLFVFSLKSNLFKSILKSPVIILCFIVLSFSILDRVFYSLMTLIMCFSPLSLAISTHRSSILTFAEYAIFKSFLSDIL